MIVDLQQDATKQDYAVRIVRGNACIVKLLIVVKFAVGTIMNHAISEQSPHMYAMFAIAEGNANLIVCTTLLNKLMQCHKEDIHQAEAIHTSKAKN